jgi:hypothetical protein
MMVFSLTTVALLCVTPAVAVGAQSAATQSDSQAVVAAAIGAGARDLFGGNKARVVSDRIERTSRNWPLSAISAAAAGSGVRIVHHADVVKCTGQRPSSCLPLDDLQVLQISEAEFHGDTAYIDATVFRLNNENSKIAVRSSQYNSKIALRSNQYIVVRRNGRWVVTGVKSATFS